MGTGTVSHHTQLKSQLKLVVHVISQQIRFLPEAEGVVALGHSIAVGRGHLGLFLMPSLDKLLDFRK